MQKKIRPIGIDPHAKLYLLVLSNLTLLFNISFTAKIILAAFLLSLYFLAGKYKS